MKKITLLLFVATALLIANSCRRDKYIPNVCFQENILPIFISKCGSAGCHNASSSSGKRERRSLTNYDDIMKGITPRHANLSELYSKISGSNPEMPPRNSPQLTAKEIEYIRFWINFGAENSSCGNSNCDTTSYITYTSAIKDILTTNCIGCHFTGNSQSIALDNYASASTSGVGQKIIARITLPQYDAQNNLDPKHMPQGYTLSPCNLTKIQKWLANGSPQ